jgi:uncharacterized protein YndB with AHSA1/START domain
VIDDDGNVVHDVRFAHPIARVWNAIVDPDALAQWLMPNDFEPGVGRRFHFDGGPPRGLFEAELLELDAPNRIRWLWMLDGVATTVTITLGSDGDATLVRVEHTGLPDDLRPRFDSGWVEKFESLRLFVNGGA